MKTEVRNGVTVLVADEGKVLVNGDTASDEVWLGKEAKPEDWTETDVSRITEASEYR